MNKNPYVHNEDIEKDIEVGDVEEIEHEEGVQAEATRIPPIDPVLYKQIISFLKGLAGRGMLPSAQIPTNPLVGSTASKMGEMEIMMVFFHPLLGSMMTGNEHDMLTKFLNLKPLVLFGSKTEDAYDFILDFYEKMHKLDIVH